MINRQKKGFEIGKMTKNETETFLEQLESGDLIIFSATKSYKNWYATLIEFITGSPYSHVGIIIKDPTFTPTPLKGLYVLESGWESENDVEQSTKKFGVMLQLLDDVVRLYDGRIWIRRLKVERDFIFYEKLSQAHSDMHNLPYDDNPIHMLSALFSYVARESIIDKRGNISEVWCSALVTYIYMKLGLIDQKTDWSMIFPFDYGEGGRIVFINSSLDQLTQIK